MGTGNTIQNPKGAFGYDDLETKLHKVTAEAEASAAIVGPAVVVIGVDGKISASPAGATTLVVGIAQRSIASGKVGSFVTAGIAENVRATGAIAAGALVKASTATIGNVEDAGATPAAGISIGIAISAAAAGVVDVWVCKR